MAEPERRLDLLVVGAGPAGSSAARVAAAAGLEVLLVERRVEVGAPVRCGEYVPRGLLGEVPAGAVTVDQTVAALSLHFPGGDRQRLRAPGAVIDRGALDRALARAAVDAGAELWTAAPLVELDRRGGALVRAPAGDRAVTATLVIGADGPRSRVARAAGLGRPRVMLGLGRSAALARPLAEAHLYFWASCRYGYGWLFPKGDHRGNLGVALPRGEGRQARRALAELGGRLVAEGVLERSEAARGGQGDPGRSGLVPCSGPLPRLAAGRIALVGDAAGQTDPLTGAGVVAAIRAGTMAGEAVAAALARGSWRRAGPSYEARWRQTLARSAARSLERRFDLEARWERDLERALRRAWLADSDSP